MGMYVNGKWREDLADNPSNRAAYGGGGGGGGGGGSNDLADWVNASSGINLKRLAQEKALADQEWKLKERQLNEIGIPTLELENRKQKFYEGHALRLYELQKQEQYAGQALDYLKTSASLGGPADWVKSWNFNRGAQGVVGLPTWLNALERGVAQTAWQAPGGDPGGPQTLASVAANMTGAAPSNDANMNAALERADKIFKAGGGALAPGVLESLDPSELAGLGGLGAARGYDVDAFLDRWKNSRIQQRAATAL